MFVTSGAGFLTSDTNEEPFWWGELELDEMYSLERVLYDLLLWVDMFKRVEEEEANV